MRNVLSWLAILAASIAPAAAVPFAGIVTGPSGPVAGATIRVRAYNRVPPQNEMNLTASTGADGRFTVDVPAGQMDVRVVPPAGSGLAEDEARFVTISGPLEGRFSLQRPVRVSGRCLFPAGHRNRVSEMHSLTRPMTQFLPVAGDGTFEATVPPDHYSIDCRAFVGSDFYGGRANIDATIGDVRNVEVAIAVNPQALPRNPPRAALVTIGPADASGFADVTGAAGAVEPRATVAVGNLMTQQLTLAVSRADGSFAARMFAPPGSFIQIKHDPTGRYLATTSFNGTLNGLAIPTGTILRVPVPGENTFAIGSVMNYYDNQLRDGDFASVSRFGIGDPGQWWLTGTLDNTAWTQGQQITLRGRITLYSRNITSSLDLANVRMTGDVSLERLFDERGGALQSVSQFMSPVMTPSGLPIERQGNDAMGGQIRMTALRYGDPHRIEADWEYVARVRSTTPPGVYLPRLNPRFEGIPLNAMHFDIPPAVQSGPVFGATFPPIRMGAAGPRRLYWLLALDEMVNGLRGGVAVEDRGKFQVASHVAISSDVHILPPRDARTGALIRYNLEPFVPMLAMSTARLTDPPLIPLRFPSGSLNVRVTRPDGVIEDLGSAPFAQSMSRMPTTRTGHDISGASSSVSDYYQLTTLDPRFDYAFTQYGRYVVSMTGWIEDVWGNRYDGGGTYEVWAARPLDIETAVLPGTPFEVGSSFATGFVVQPPVPAEVDVTVKLFPGTGAVRTTHSSGRANRFGFGRIGGFTHVFDEPGEYRCDIVARHIAADGTLWMGTATWGSIVETPNASLIAKGRRGFDGVGAIQQQWFRVREARAGGDHVMFPYHSGDVMWMQKDDPAADIPKISIQDPLGILSTKVRSRRGAFEPPSLQDRITAGEIPLYSWSAEGVDPSTAPELVDQWGYFYAFAERPGVRVREFISEDNSGNGYWRFSDNYHFQLGNGTNGDLPNDFKFQFGGAVFRDTTDAFRWFGAYASFFVILPFGDLEGGRVFPPFQGNGGGPNGGPLFTLKGKPIDLFLHLTGARPGAILHRGERASFPGYAAPTLPAKIEIVVTSPSGSTRTIAAQANKVGYFHEPATDFELDESGVWKAKVKIVYDGRTSAGQLSEPFPTGGVLGSREGEFYFYVVEPDAPQLELRSMPSFVRPADGPINFTIVPPAGLSNVQLTWTTTMPGFILEEGTSTAMTYSYGAQKLSADFPNLDLHDFDGYAGADTITISLLFSGTDASGTRRHFGRVVVIQGEEVQMPDQLSRPRRRVVSVR